MPIEIRKVVRPLKLSEFAQEYGDQVIEVWVNPPRAKRAEYARAAFLTRTGVARLDAPVTEETPELDEETRTKIVAQIAEGNEGVFAYFGELWSQGPDVSKHLTSAQVKDFAVRCMEEDQALWSFMVNRTLALIEEHRVGEKKG
ncbi:MAG TPA: hypothetical protein DCP69_09490 [Candidatus Omnitrophica bacterium]|nr:hypothetical protein [Candidatus Omnitrophota bacterium]